MGSNPISGTTCRGVVVVYVHGHLLAWSWEISLSGRAWTVFLWVQFPLQTTAFLFLRRSNRCIAQLVERWSHKPKVDGSSPSAPTTKFYRGRTSARGRTSVKSSGVVKTTTCFNRERGAQKGTELDPGSCLCSHRQEC